MQVLSPSLLSDSSSINLDSTSGGKDVHKKKIILLIEQTALAKPIFLAHYDKHVLPLLKKLDKKSLNAVYEIIAFRFHPPFSKVVCENHGKFVDLSSLDRTLKGLSFSDGGMCARTALLEGLLASIKSFENNSSHLNYCFVMSSSLPSLKGSFKHPGQDIPFCLKRLLELDVRLSLFCSKKFGMEINNLFISSYFDTGKYSVKHVNDNKSYIRISGIESDALDNYSSLYSPSSASSQEKFESGSHPDKESALGLAFEVNSSSSSEDSSLEKSVKSVESDNKTLSETSKINATVSQAPNINNIMWKGKLCFNSKTPQGNLEYSFEVNVIPIENSKLLKKASIADYHCNVWPDTLKIFSSIPSNSQIIAKNLASSLIVGFSPVVSTISAKSNRDLYGVLVDHLKKTKTGAVIKVSESFAIILLQNADRLIGLFTSVTASSYTPPTRSAVPPTHNTTTYSAPVQQMQYLGLPTPSSPYSIHQSVPASKRQASDSAFIEEENPTPASILQRLQNKRQNKGS